MAKTTRYKGENRIWPPQSSSSTCFWVLSKYLCKYKIITDTNADAQAIFLADTEQAEREQFILEQQLLMVRGAGVAGMRFHVTDAITGADIEGVLIILKEGVTVTTDQTGRALKLQLAAADYAIAAQKTGYNQFNSVITVQTGAVKRVNIQPTQ